MKPNRAGSRKSITITSSRWVAYATAGAATALGAAAAEADIHYSGIVHEPLIDTVKTFPLSNGAVLWFANYVGTPFSHYNRALFSLIGAAVSGEWRTDRLQGYPANLRPAQFVSRGNFRGDIGVLASGYYTSLNFDEPGRGFIGFKFNTGGGAQYGWARLKMCGPPQNCFIVVDYAWADIGEPIRTGETHHFSQEQGAVSPSGSLGLLALGKAGIDAWRH